MLGDSPFNWAVYRGWASTAQQAELYKKFKAGGPMAAPPFHSAHEACSPEGEPAALAVDVVRLSSTGEELWDYETHAAWGWLWHACKIHPRLHSGHEFPPKAPADNDHIQYQSEWQIYKANLRAAGKW